jgi:hypothetical protein
VVGILAKIWSWIFVLVLLILGLICYVGYRLSPPLPQTIFNRKKQTVSIVKKKLKGEVWTVTYDFDERLLFIRERYLHGSTFYTLELPTITKISKDAFILKSCDNLNYAKEMRNYIINYMTFGKGSIYQDDGFIPKGQPPVIIDEEIAKKIKEEVEYQYIDKAFLAIGLIYLLSIFLVSTGLYVAWAFFSLNTDECLIGVILFFLATLLPFSGFWIYIYKKPELKKKYNEYFSTEAWAKIQNVLSVFAIVLFFLAVITIISIQIYRIVT